jgi:hypothetical protein
VHDLQAQVVTSWGVWQLLSELVTTAPRAFSPLFAQSLRPI